MQREKSQNARSQGRQRKSQRLIVESPCRIKWFPTSGRIVPEFSDENIRELIYGSYRIIYLFRKNACFATVVAHANRNTIFSLRPHGVGRYGNVT